jgi:hypothetical protein
MVLYSESGQATSTANFLQAVMSVPRIREMIATMQEVDDKQSGKPEKIGDWTPDNADMCSDPTTVEDH